MLDDSSEAHERLLNATRDAVLANMRADDNSGDNSAFYVQSFIIAASGMPVSVWRWDSNEGTFTESTRSELVSELTFDKDESEEVDVKEANDA